MEQTTHQFDFLFGRGAGELDQVFYYLRDRKFQCWKLVSKAELIKKAKTYVDFQLDTSLNSWANEPQSPFTNLQRFESEHPGDSCPIPSTVDFYYLDFSVSIAPFVQRGKQPKITVAFNSQIKTVGWSEVHGYVNPRVEKLFAAAFKKLKW